MSDPTEMFPDELFDLFSAKQLHELTPSEKELVNQYMDIDEYNQYAHSVMSFTSIDNALAIPPLGLPVKRSTNALKRFWQFKLPLYQAAVASILLITATVFLLQFSNRDDGVSTTQLYTAAESNARVLDKQALDRHLSEIKLVINKTHSPKGISLADDNYPHDLVFDF